MYTASPKRYQQAEGFYRRCGKSGIMLPSISLGLWKNFGSEADFNDSLTMLHYAFDHGIVHFDLANNYGTPYGSAEQTLGRAMKESLGRYRDELFISTKAGYDMWEGPYGNWGSRKYLVSSLNQSLSRMNLDYVDLFYSHRYDPNTPLDETLQALVDIVRSGKALYVGISRWPLPAFNYAIDYLAARDVPCLTYQGRINMLDRAPIDEGILKTCVGRGIGFVSFSPLAQGLLTDRYLNDIPADSRMRNSINLTERMLTPEVKQRLLSLNEEARTKGMKLSQMALKWVLEQPGVTSVIVGVSRMSQLKENLEWIVK